MNDVTNEPVKSEGEPVRVNAAAVAQAAQRLADAGRAECMADPALYRRLYITIAAQTKLPSGEALRRFYRSQMETNRLTTAQIVRIIEAQAGNNRVRVADVAKRLAAIEAQQLNGMLERGEGSPRVEESDNAER